MIGGFGIIIGLLAVVGWNGLQANAKIVGYFTGQRESLGETVAGASCSVFRHAKLLENHLLIYLALHHPADRERCFSYCEQLAGHLVELETAAHAQPASRDIISQLLTAGNGFLPASKGLIAAHDREMAAKGVFSLADHQQEILDLHAATRTIRDLGTLLGEVKNGFADPPQTISVISKLDNLVLSLESHLLLVVTLHRGEDRAKFFQRHGLLRECVAILGQREQNPEGKEMVAAAAAAVEQGFTAGVRLLELYDQELAAIGSFDLTRYQEEVKSFRGGIAAVIEQSDRLTKLHAAREDLLLAAAIDEARNVQNKTIAAFILATVLALLVSAGFYRAMSRDIAVRLQAEADLRASENRYRSMLAEIESLHQQMEFVLGATKTFLHIIDTDYNLRYVDAATRVRRGDPTGRKCYAYLQEQSAVCFGCGVVRALTTNSAVVSEHFVVKEGRPVQATAIPFVTGDGERLIASVVVDISDRKQAEEKLRESEERFREIVENISYGVWISDLKSMECLYVSPALETIWGRSREELYRPAGAWLANIHGEDRDRVAAALPRILSENIAEELRIIRPDGSIAWVRARLFPIRNADGKVYRIAGTAEDIGEYRQMAEKMRESEVRYRTVFEHSVDGISICMLEQQPGRGVGLRMVDCNESCTRMAGMEKSALLACPDLRELHQIIPASCECEMARGREQEGQGALCGEIFSWRRPDGKENYIECRGLPVVIAQETFILCIYRDITERMRAEGKIRDLSRRLIIVAEEERKRIAQDLHDEFGQLFPPLTYAVDAIREAVAGGQPAVLARVEEVSRLLLRLGNTVRQLSSQLRPDTLDQLGLLPTLESCVFDLGSRQPDLEVDFKIVGTAKPMSAEIEIVLYRIAQEALSNIYKHAQASRVSVLVTFSHPHVILLVRDDGSGFNALQQLARASSGKSGIGLRGMEERATSVGGRLSIKSEIGRGTVLRAELPLSCGRPG